HRKPADLHRLRVVPLRNVIPAITCHGLALLPLKTNLYTNDVMYRTTDTWEISLPLSLTLKEILLQSNIPIQHPVPFPRLILDPILIMPGDKKAPVALSMTSFHDRCSGLIINGLLGLFTSSLI
ncbi:MAG: hypothetical protein OEY60_07040, partial [Nitrospira sp.]|nr:hypothetical protein [Nitrospira sp.]